MPRGPEIPLEEIVDFILSGKTTSEATEHFGLADDNVTALKVHAAFRKLGTPRPRYRRLKRGKGKRWGGGDITRDDH